MTMAAARAISFRDNVANRHGEVYRSSAIFYVPPTDRVRTTLSFLDYWSLKRGLQVTVLASTRDMAGRLLGRERLRFEAGQVINYQPPVEPGFEGSVEVEVLALENLAIPYAAIIAWYDTAQGTSLVHSYARAYSTHEIEEGRVVDHGREGCWTVLDDAQTRSFGVAHNGASGVPAQSVRLAVRNARGEVREVQRELPALKPYESLRIEPGEWLPELPEFLGGSPGHAEVDFALGGGFTRMLLGNERRDGSDLQVTHSNFNYAVQPTDLAGADALGWMAVPALPVRRAEVLVYPQSSPGAYRVQAAAEAQQWFRSGEPVWVTPQAPQTLTFSASEGEFPTRLVTALRVAEGEQRIANECSLGVITRLQPPKRLWWGPVRCEPDVHSQLVVHDLPQVYGGIPAAAALSLRLYSASQAAPLETQLSAGDLPALEQGMSVDALWPQAEAFLAGEAGYYTLYCDYGGLTAYTLTRNAQGSVSLEHGF